MQKEKKERERRGSIKKEKHRQWARVNFGRHDASYVMKVPQRKAASSLIQALCSPIQQHLGILSASPETSEKSKIRFCDYDFLY